MSAIDRKPERKQVSLSWQAHKDAKALAAIYARDSRHRITIGQAVARAVWAELGRKAGGAR